MLEYFTYKKVKQHQAEKRAEAGVQTPLINDDDQNFLERIVSAEGTPPPLPARPLGSVIEAGDSTNNKSQMVVHDGNDAAPEQSTNEKGKKAKGKENKKGSKKSNRFSFLNRSSTKKVLLYYLPFPASYLTAY